MKTRILQQKPATRRPHPSTTSLPLPRPFAAQENPVRAAAAPGLAAPPGHDFGDVAVHAPTPSRPGANRTGLPDTLKQGMERVSGVPLDDVRVHYRSAAPAGVGAHAFTQGNRIHVAPGAERHLPHEAWHAVQQKQGRVRATGQVAGAALNDSNALEREADAMGAAAVSRAGSVAQAGPSYVAPPAVQAGTGPAVPERAPIQRWKWLRNFFRRRPEQQPLAPRAHRRQLQGADPEAAAANHAIARATASSQANEYVAKGTSVTSAGASAVRHLGDVTKLVHAGFGVPVLAAAGPAATALGALTDGITNVRDLKLGGRQREDQAGLALNLTSNLGKGATNSILAATHSAALAGKPYSAAATSTLGHVAAPAALAMGAADIVGGGLSAYRAGQRGNRLGDLRTHEPNRPVWGLAEFAQEQQHTKKHAGRARVLKGALGVAGGAALLAGGLSNPVGWALLGGAALVGGGISAYRARRQYQQGKRLLNDEAYRGRLAEAMGEHALPDPHDPKNQGMWNTYKLHDAVRGHVAHELAARETGIRAGIRSFIGLKNSAPGFAHNATDKEKQKAVRQIARALKA